jgi:autotransporter-associated beta strand protein
MAVTVNASGTLKLASAEEIATLAGAGAVNLQGNALTVSGSGDSVYSGVMSGTGGSLVKSGSGVLTLSGVNTFTGGASVSAGTVLVGNDAAFGTGSVTFSGGKISSNGTTARMVANALGLSGMLALGDGTNTGAMTFSGAAALSATTTLN